MFEVTWGAILTLFSILLEQNDQIEIWRFCLQGFSASIKSTSRFSMQTELDVFVSSLAKFAILNCLREMKEENIECVQLLLNLSLWEGNYLKGSWIHVL